jgi:hypothetical protein
MDTSAPDASVEEKEEKSTARSATNIFSRTIISHLISLFSSAPRPLSTQEVVSELQQRVSELRRADGGKYSGNVKKAVLGCLQQNEVFECVEGTWRMDVAAAQAYTERRISAIADRYTQARSNKPKRLSRSRHNRLITFLDQKLSEASYLGLFPLGKNMFRGIVDSDSGKQIAMKLGMEKATGIAQAFELVKRMYQSISRESEEMSLGTDLAKAVKEIEVVADRIQADIREIRSSN